MPDFVAERRLVKSPPELWAELSEPERLAKHLGAFGEIRITKVEPESSVDWEGEHASGSVWIDPSGWGTKVRLKAMLPEPPAGEPAPAEPVTDSAAAPPAPKPPGVEPEAEPAPEPEAEPAPEAVAEPAPRPQNEPAPVEHASPEAPEANPGPPGRPSRRGLFARWIRAYRGRRDAAPQRDPEPDPKPALTEPEPSPVEVDPDPAEPAPAPVAEEQVPSEPESTPEPDSEPKSEPTPEAEAESEPEAEPSGIDPETAQVVLDEVLDNLGAAHHRPFSRA